MACRDFQRFDSIGRLPQWVFDISTGALHIERDQPLVGYARQVVGYDVGSGGRFMPVVSCMVIEQLGG